MDSGQLQRYMNELKKVKNGFQDMRRESDILEREFGFGLGGFPSLMDNAESIIKHALGSVTDQLQRRIGHQEDPKQLQGKPFSHAPPFSPYGWILISLFRRSTAIWR